MIQDQESVKEAWIDAGSAGWYGIELIRDPWEPRTPQNSWICWYCSFPLINYQHHQLCCGVFVDLAESSFEPCEDRPHTGEWDTEPNMDMGQNLHSFQTTG